MNERLSRIIRLLGLLTSGHVVNATYLAEALSCGKRTVFRDLRALKSCGYKIYYDEDFGRYRIEVEHSLRQTHITESELIALTASAYTSHLAHSPGVAPDLNQAIAKILRHQRHEVRERVTQLIRAIHPDLCNTDAKATSPKILAAIISSIQNKRCLRVKCVPSSAESSFTTKLSVYQLVARPGQLLIIGRSSFHRQVVRMAIGTITEVTELEESYTVPKAFLCGRTQISRYTFSGDATTSTSARPEIACNQAI